MTHSTVVLVEQLAARLVSAGQLLAVAESCTGGLLAAACTERAGSSRWFDRGWVTYSNDAKAQCLGVKEATLNAHGAVSEAVVIAMTQGVLRASAASWAVAISGIAGPDGGCAAKPVGTVWFAVQQKNASAQATCVVFAGDRAQVRAQAVNHALTLLLNQMNELTEQQP